MASHLVSLVLLTYLIAGPVVSQAPKPDDAKPKMTKAEKLAAWNGQRVTILGEQPLRCPNQTGEFSSELTRFAEKSPYGPRLKVADYAGQTGVIQEVTSAERGVQQVIELEKGQRLLIGSETPPVGFHEELKFAQAWVGRDLWLKERTWESTTAVVEPEAGLCSDRSAEPLDLPKLTKLTVTAVEFGSSRQPILLQVRTEDGQSGWLRVPGLFFLEQFSSYNPRTLADAFHLDDPQKMHPTWGSSIWKLIREGRVAVGMTEEQARMACGGEMQPEGAILVGQAVSTIYLCPKNNRFLVENGKVKEYVEFRRVP